MPVTVPNTHPRAQMPPASRGYLIPFTIVTTLFFLWGFVTVFVDALIPRMKAAFELTYFQAGLVQFAFFGAYALISLPAGTLISKWGYKKGILMGLATMGVGCFLFYPAAELRIYVLFLFALFVLAGGITILQVAANPYVAALGPVATASSRLNLSQAFNSLGTTLAPLLSAAYLLGGALKSQAELAQMDAAAKAQYYVDEAHSVQLPFALIGGVLLAIALIVSFCSLPPILENKEDQHVGTKRWSIWKYPALVKGAIGIFLYVGAEVTIGSYLVNYLMYLDIGALLEENPGLSAFVSWMGGHEVSEMTPIRLGGTLAVFYWGAAMIGRFVGSLLVRFIRPAIALGWYAVAASLFVCVSMLGEGMPAVLCILAVGLCNSIMFPTIFTLAIEGMGEHTAKGSGVLCASIVGGAVIPPLYGALADVTDLRIALLLVCACYVYIAYFGFNGRGIRKASALQSVSLEVPDAA